LARTFRAIQTQHQTAIEHARAERDQLVRQVEQLRGAARRALAVEVAADGAVVRQIGEELSAAEERLAKMTGELTALTSITVSERDVYEAFQSIDPIWDELFPAEQERIIRLLVEVVLVGPDGLELHLRTDGLAEFTAEVGAGTERRVA
jgi:hypothetical protein